MSFKIGDRVRIIQSGECRATLHPEALGRINGGGSSVHPDEFHGVEGSIYTITPEDSRDETAVAMALQDHQYQVLFSDPIYTSNESLPYHGSHFAENELELLS
jgi:uncharacterized surface anchored protein